MNGLLGFPLAIVSGDQEAEDAPEGVGHDVAPFKGTGREKVFLDELHEDAESDRNGEGDAVLFLWTHLAPATSQIGEEREGEKCVEKKVADRVTAKG